MRVLGLHDDYDGDGSEAALLFTPTSTALGLGMPCPSVAGFVKDLRGLNGGLGTDDDVHAAALWGALKDSTDPALGCAQQPAQETGSTSGKFLALRNLAIVAHGGGGGSEPERKEQRVGNMTRDDLPPPEHAYSIDAAESSRLAAEAMVALVPTKVLYVPLNHKAGEPTDTQHFSPDNPLKGSWNLWAAIGMAIEGNHDSICAFDLGSDWTDPYKEELRNDDSYATRPWARATSHVLRRLAHNFDTSDTSDQEGIRYTTIANDVHGEIDTQALAEALETLERENYVDLVHTPDARTAPPCDEDIVISKGPRYARGLARVEREMQSASNEHTPQGQRTARLYAVRGMSDDLPLPPEHTPPRPPNNDATALVGTDLGKEMAATATATPTPTHSARTALATPLDPPAAPPDGTPNTVGTPHLEPTLENTNPVGERMPEWHLQDMRNADHRETTGQGTPVQAEHTAARHMAFVTGRVRQQNFLRYPTTGHPIRLNLSELTWRESGKTARTPRTTQRAPHTEAPLADASARAETGSPTDTDAAEGPTLRRTDVRHSTQTSDTHACSQDERETCDEEADATQQQRNPFQEAPYHSRDPFRVEFVDVGHSSPGPPHPRRH